MRQNSQLLVPDTQSDSRNLHLSLFSAAYWKVALHELRDLRKLTFAALMTALCIILGMVPSIPLARGLSITWGFFGRAACAMVCGPVLGLVFGFTEDILSFFITGGGGYPFFPGYTLTTMLGVLIYALCFYRAKITIGRVFLAKFLTNLQNVLLGALWTAILTQQPYWVTASLSAGKNLLLWPIQAILLAEFLWLLEPALRRTKLLPPQV